MAAREKRRSWSSLDALEAEEVVGAVELVAALALGGGGSRPSRW